MPLYFSKIPQIVASDQPSRGDEHSDPSFSLLGREWRQLFGRCFHFENGQAGGVWQETKGTGVSQDSPVRRTPQLLWFARLMRLTRLLRMARHGKIAFYGWLLAGPLCWLDKRWCPDKTTIHAVDDPCSFFCDQNTVQVTLFWHEGFKDCHTASDAF